MRACKICKLNDQSKVFYSVCTVFGLCVTFYKLVSNKESRFYSTLTTHKFGLRDNFCQEKTLQFLLFRGMEIFIATRGNGNKLSGFTISDPLFLVLKSKLT